MNPGLRKTVGRVPPVGPFRFVALDVETANATRSSICQVGLACVRNNESIETWSTYVNPGTDDWSCSWVHGITPDFVVGCPSFPHVMEVLNNVIGEHVVFQHSSFDRSAINAACVAHARAVPDWEWRDSVRVARTAWPELRGNGGHGLSSLKQYLGLTFRHHDGEEDARAAAEIVLRAERLTRLGFLELSELKKK